VPFFYYVVHFWMAHVIASALAYVRYGPESLAFLFMPLPSMGGAGKAFPPDFGYPLWVSYLVWIAVVVLMYPLCRIVADFKAWRKAWWTSYLGWRPRWCQTPTRRSMSSARWLARNSIIRTSASPFLQNGSSLMIASISSRLLPTARMIPPSRGIFRPDTRKFPAA